MSDPPQGWTLHLQNWRVIKHAHWSPEGVCLLAGPNGSGKTTLLEALSFLRSVWLRGVKEAIGYGRGPSFLRRLGADEHEPVSIGLDLGELHWEIQFALDGTGVHPYHGEVLHRGEVEIFNCPLFAYEWTLDGQKERRSDTRPCLRIYSEDKKPDELNRLTELLSSIRIYGVYSLQEIFRFAGSVEHAADSDLHPTGRNLLWVLRNWKSAHRRYGDQFQWVLKAMREAFPDQIQDIELDSLATAVTARVYPPDAPSPDDSLPIHLMADGVLTGLLHLTAVAGAKEGSIVAIDEMENQLHPWAIRSILESMRAIAEERNLTVILTTHSTVLMNSFKGFTDQFYVLESGADPTPVALDEHRDPDWLAHFSLGDLYDRLDFAAPGHLDLEAPGHPREE